MVAVAGWGVFCRVLGLGEVRGVRVGVGVGGRGEGGGGGIRGEGGVERGKGAGDLEVVLSFVLCFFHGLAGSGAYDKITITPTMIMGLESLGG